MLYALCGISGSGKTTLLEAVLQQMPRLARLVTYTTRPPRPGEVAGRAYHFVTDTRFQEVLTSAPLVCPIQYRGYWYGTAEEDIRACQRQATLAVLRPDKFAALALYTPLRGIYLEMLGRETPATPEDWDIVVYRNACDVQLTNVPGQLDLTVNTLVHYLHAQRESAQLQGDIYGPFITPPDPA